MALARVPPDVILFFLEEQPRMGSRTRRRTGAALAYEAGISGVCVWGSRAGDRTGARRGRRPRDSYRVLDDHGRVQKLLRPDARRDHAILSPSRTAAQDKRKISPKLMPKSLPPRLGAMRHPRQRQRCLPPTSHK